MLPAFVKIRHCQGLMSNMVPFKKLLKDLVFPGANILVGILLTGIFIFAGRNISQTFAVANMTALNYLRPYPIGYLWDLNIHHAQLDKNKIRCFADYYEHLLQAFPSLRDAYGILGYCYHYLNDDPKAINFLKTAIQNDPDYFWNYYNLAVIYINESRYQEATDLLQRALQVNPMTSFKRMAMSSWVYAPLLGSDQKEIVVRSLQHLNETYRLIFIIEQILKHIQDKKEAQEMMKRFHLEIYAF